MTTRSRAALATPLLIVMFAMAGCAGPQRRRELGATTEMASESGVDGRPTRPAAPTSAVRRRDDGRQAVRGDHAADPGGHLHRPDHRDTEVDREGAGGGDPAGHVVGRVRRGRADHQRRPGRADRRLDADPAGARPRASPRRWTPSPGRQGGAPEPQVRGRHHPGPRQRRAGPRSGAEHPADRGAAGPGRRSCGDIIAIESDLARRQADLDSLKSQQAWLEDQTSLSTINVHLARPQVQAPEDEARGFLAGLEDGWDALANARRSCC